MLHIVSRSVLLGVRRAMVAVLGCLLAIGLVLAAAAASLAALLLAVPQAFEVLRYVGAAYLAYLRLRAWLSTGLPFRVRPDPLETLVSRMRVLRGGFLISLSNPKLLLFAIAFFPQFIDAKLPYGPQFAILLTTDLVTEGLWCFVYANFGQVISTYIGRPPLTRVFHRVAGTIFIGFGLALLNIKRT